MVVGVGVGRGGHLVFSLSCLVLISFSLGWPLCISWRDTWFTTATRDAWLFISGSRLSNLKADGDGSKSGGVGGGGSSCLTGVLADFIFENVTGLHKHRGQQITRVTAVHLGLGSHLNVC